MILNIFWKRKIPRTLPVGMLRAISKLKKTKSKKECLRKAYQIMSRKYEGRYFDTIFRFWRLFIWDVDKLWSRKGFMHCNHQTFLLRILLVRSGWFKENDIKQKLTLVWYISLHQYLQVRVEGGKWINIDVWSHNKGIKFGDYVHGFN